MTQAHTSTEQPETLLPCPFCGAEAKTYQTGARTSGHGESSDQVGVCCTGCGQRIEEGDYAGQQVAARTARCVKKWNTRTPASQARVPLSGMYLHACLTGVGWDVLDLAKRWAANEVHVYQVAAQAEAIATRAIRNAESAHGITQEKQG